MKFKGEGLATNSIILTFVQCFTYASSIIQTMILSRVFTKFEYGTYSQGMLLVSFTAPFLLLGLSNAANYFYNREEIDGEERTEKFVKTIYTMVAALGLLGGVLIITLQNPIKAYFSNEELLPLIYVLAFRPLLQNMVSFFQVLYVSSGKVRLIAVRNTIVSVVQLLIATIAAFLLNSIILVCVLLVVTDLLQVLIFHIYFNRVEFKVLPIAPQSELVSDILKYSLPLALSTAIGTISINMDTLMIGKIMSTESFAMYSNMAKELPFNLIISSFATVIYPKIVNLTAKGQKEKMVYTYKLYVELGLLVTWILVFGAIAAGKELVLILYSEKYVSGLPIFLVYLLVSGLRFTYYGALLTANGDTKSIFKYSVFSLICNFVLNIGLFYLIGIIGPAIATFVTVLSTGYLQINKGVKTIGLRIRDVFDIKFVSCFFATSIIAVILISLLKSYIEMIPVFPRGILMFILTAGLLAVIFRKRIIYNISELNKQ